MGTQIIVRSRYNRFKALVYKILRWPYAVTAICGYILVGILVLGYLNKPPTYASDISMVLPGTGNSSNLNIAEIGQVTSQTSTPFVSANVNPIVNYKEMLKSRTVIAAAAKSMGLTPEAFDKPRVELTEQTAILRVTMNGRSPEGAQQKALALYNAFQAELTRLRTDEALMRQESMKSVLFQYERNLDEARMRIANFQQRSIVIASTQLSHLTATQAALREKKMFAQAELSRSEHYVEQLSRDLGMSPALAGQAFALQSDSEFRGYLAELTSSASQLSEFSSRWGENHPKVKAMRERYERSRFELVNRSRNILGIQTGEILSAMDLQTSPTRSQLFSDLVNAYAQLKGLEAQLTNLKNDEEAIEDKLRIFARESAALERLENEYKLAEAIFTSIVGKLEAGKSDIFASYPVVQLLMAPSIPANPSSPKLVIAIGAGGAGCFFITLAIIILWQRRYLIQLLLKKN
jgi:uncharacterized protein involved in exopolysaccharide biosynthesis